MCYHNTVTDRLDKLKQRYARKAAPEFVFTPIFHASGFSFPIWPVITTEQPDTLTPLHWGLVPFWVKNSEQAQDMRSRCLNAMSETAFEKPSFRSVIGSKRCLIPSTGFFEWRDYNGKKYPYWIGSCEADIFSLAGVYDTWTDKATGEVLTTFAILTTEANPLMAQIHNTKKRMPVILPPATENDWLDSSLKKDNIKKLMVPYPAGSMQCHTISKLITSRKESSNVPAVADPFTYPELPALLPST